MIEIFGALFIIVLGTLFHFMYDWTNHNKIVGFFTAVNESTWEHLKLIIAPSFLLMILEYHFYYQNPMFFFAKFIGLLSMLLIIPIIFYTYKVLVKKNSAFVNIGSFFVSAICGQLIFHALINISYSNLILKHIGIIGLLIIFFIYITSTFVPTKNFLYKDPLTNKYGFQGHQKDTK